MDAGSILGMSAVRPPFLDDVSAAQSRESEARDGAGFVTNGDNSMSALTLRYRTEDEPDDDDLDDEDEDEFQEGEEDGDEDDDEDEEEEETWQVAATDAVPLKDSQNLTSGNELPRLAPIFQLS